MRDLVLSAFVAAIALIALVRPGIGIMGYIWFALMRPDVLAYSSGRFPHSLVLAVATILGSLPQVAAVTRLVTNPFSVLLLLLQVPITMSIVVNDSSITSAVDVYIRAVIMSLFIVILIRTEHDLRRLMLVIAISIGVIGAKYGILGAAQGGIRITQGYGDGMMSGNNELGLAFLMIVPFCWYGRDLVDQAWAKRALGIMALGNVAGTIFTYSRGDAIGLAVVALLIAARSKRKLMVFGVVALVAGGAIYLIGDSYLGRMATLKDPEQEASAAQRLEQNRVALAMWQDYPIFGTGFGGEKYQSLNREYGGGDSIHIVHNTYLQLLVEAGISTLMIYALLLGWTLIWLQKSLRRAREGGGLAAYPLALQTSLIGFAAVIVFHPRARYDLYYILIMTVSAWYFVQKGLAADVTEGAPDGANSEAVEACQAH